MQAPSSPLESRTFWELLHARAELHGQRRACTFLTDGEQTEATLTYAQLDCRARQIGAWLQQHDGAGKPVLLVYPQGLDFIAAFVGCLYAGAIAIPAYPPRRNRRAARICCMVSDADVRIALSTAEIMDQMGESLRQDPLLSRPLWQSTDELEPALAANWSAPEVTAESLAFLQYTSGSIGDPKGVMVSHANLLENQRLICHSFRQDEGIVVVGWLPLHHDMGLIGNMLHPLYLGGHFVFMAPVAFLQQPIRWPAAVSRYRATITGGPNFAYDLCVTSTSLEQRSGLDLSSLTVAYTGAERVQDATLSKFEQAFAPCGFSRDMFCPCYGLAETTLITTGIVKHEPVVVARLDPHALAREDVVPLPCEGAERSTTRTEGTTSSAKPIDLVSCGKPAPSVDVRIVNPDSLTECPPGRVGEIWVAGATVAQGYWGKPELTQESFAARLASDREQDDAPRYLRTGDLGFLLDGHLYIAGRLKDLIIVRGGNHYPSDIEQTASAAHESLIVGSCAAFSVDVDGDEQVVLIQEVHRSQLRQIDKREVCEAIRQAVVDDHLVPLHAILLVRPGSIPKTTSGKVQRRHARRMFEKGEFTFVACWNATESPATAAPGDNDPTVSALAAESCDTAPYPVTYRQQQEINNLQRWILSRLAEHLQVDPRAIDPRQPFARYGVDSLKAVRMTGELEEHLGRSIPPTLLFDYPNLDTLVRYLVLGESRDTSAETGRRDFDEPIAVVGIGCCFPGGSSPAAFWHLLSTGRDAIGPVPVERWGAARQRMSDVSAATRTRVLQGGFLERVDQFDAEFFGINAREADEMDPQQRLLLHVAWEACENAGLAPDQLAGTRTGVFLGVSGNEYGHLQSASQHGPSIYRATGNSLAVIANRLSFLLDLRGPSFAVDTACSSSLVAVHQACVSLRRGECIAAIAGGVSLIVSPDATAALSQAGMLSPTGRCHAFSSEADGFVRGEGCGVLLLKRLSDAQAAGDRIVCLLRGSAVNQDGRSNGLTAPNGLAQQAVIRSALADAQLEPQAIDYVEAHGTGTALGDPIEMGALQAVFAPGRAPEQPLYVGSVKTNIGHLEGAAGIAGLIKVCLAFEQQALPPHLHWEQPSTHIDWNWPLRIPTAVVPWTTGPRVRCAGVSSFGFGGTNAHVIVQEAPPQPARTDAPEGPTLLVLSAKTPTALQTQARQLAAVATDTPRRDLCYTAAVGRAHLAHRLAMVAHDPGQLQHALTQFAQQQQVPGLLQGQTRRDCAVAWVFGGQGVHAPGVGQQLYQQDGTFRQLLDDVCAVAADYWPVDLRHILWEDATRWEQVDIQVALLGLQISLARLWRHYGLAPSAVLGHSLGEYAAACLAGVFSLSDAFHLVSTRARLMDQLPTPGRMLAVLAPPETVRGLLGETLDIAAVNGPRQTVVAGRAEDVEQLAQVLADRQLRCQVLPTTHAFHSPLVEPLLEAFGEAAEQVRYALPTCRLLSSLLGRPATHEVAQAGYWQQHLRHTVCFQQAAEHLLADKPTAVLELGVGSTLVGLIKSVARTAAPVLLKGLSGGATQWTEQLTRLGQLYVLGADLDWSAVWDAAEGRKVALPTYPFEPQRYWFTPTTVRSGSDGDPPARGAVVHPLLGQRLDLAGRELVYATRLSADSFLQDHRLGAQVVFPATGYLELALAAGQDAGFQLLQVEQLKIRRPLELDATAARSVQVVLTPQEEGLECRILGRAAQGAWQLHATCQLRRTDWRPSPRRTDFQPFTADVPLPADVEVLSVAEHYARCDQLGLHYGPAFQGLERLWRGRDRAWGHVRLPRGVEADGYLLHPALLDACLQVTAGALREDIHTAAWLPVKIKAYRVSGECTGATELQIHVCRVHEGNRASRLTVDITGATLDGRGGFSITGLQFQRMHLHSTDDLIFHETWVSQLRQRERSPTIPELAIGDVADDLEVCRATVAARTGLAAHTLVLDELESHCSRLIDAAIRDHFPQLRDGHAFTLQEGMETLQVTADHQRLFRRLLQILEEDGVLQRRGESWVAQERPLGSDRSRELAQWIARHPAAEPELTLVHRCAGQLLSVLRGETDPLTLLFPSDGSISAGSLYRDSVGGQAMNTLIAEAVARIVRDLPEGRGVRILEIGAGTGSTTESIVRRLPNERTSYVFTDIAASFLPAARQRFSAHGNMQFHVLDIERDPHSQGFEPGTFDVVIAANVIHATRNIAETLQNIHGLLTPGGALIVLEGTRPVRWLDLTFGLTDGWWRFSDTQLRPEYPLLSGGNWLNLLNNVGFPSARVVTPLPMAIGQREPENSVIVAQRGDTAGNGLSATPTSQDSARWLVLADQRGVGEQLAERLRAEGALCQVVDAPSQLNDVLGGDNIPANVVYLRPLDVGDAQSPAHRAQELNQALLDTVQAVAQQRRAHVSGNGHPPADLRFWVVTRGAQVAGDDNDRSVAQASLWGFVRTLALEHQDWQTCLIDLDPCAAGEAVVGALLDEVTRAGQEDENEIAFRGGRRLARRLRRGPATDATSCANASVSLQIAARGTFDGLEFRQQTRPSPGPEQLEVAVHASGLNFRDVLNVLGQYPGEPPLGAECSGVVTRVGTNVERFSPGDHVLVVAPNTFCDWLVVDQRLAIAIPQHLALADAATIPIAFLTASLALEEIGRIQSGDRVLIHAAAGGVGLACIQLARAVGAEVFATASVGKHETLRNMGIEHVFDSRRTGFAAAVMAATSARGVDLVLNALGQEFIQENVRCLAQDGRYLDITKTPDVREHPALVARPDIRYHSLDLAQLLADEPDLLQSKLPPLVGRVVDGPLRPLPARCFALSEAKSAFRFMRSAQHIGKLLLCTQQQTHEERLTSVDTRWSRTDRRPEPIRRDRSYVITGGLGGLGLAVARWLARQDAGHIALMARRAPNDQERSAIDEIVRNGAAVTLLRADVERLAEVSDCLAAYRETAQPLGGVFHLAGRLDDALILRQSASQFARVLGPKTHGAWNLHIATLGDNLDHFVLFSSVSSVLGSTGQANHAAANAFLDGLARYRRTQGLPASTINWGPWSGIGAAAQREIGKRSDLAGIGLITPNEGISLLEALMGRETLQAAALRLDIDQLPARWRALSLFQSLRHAVTKGDTGTQHDSRFLREYRQAPDSRKRGVLLSHLQSLVARTLGIRSPESIDLDQALSDMGLDSLATLELANNLEESLSVAVPSTLVYDYPTLNGMADYFLGRVDPSDPTDDPSDSTDPADQPAAQPTDSTDLLQNIRELSDELDRWDEV